MAQSIAMLAQMGSGFMPLAPGVAPEIRTGMEGMPFVGQGGLASLAAMVAFPQLQRAMGGVGMTPMGVGHDQNVYDILRAMQFTRLQMGAMQAAAESDRGGFMDSFRGLAAITGTPFGAAERRAADSLAGAAVTAAPLLAAIAPEFLDQLSGNRGSATVLTRRVAEAGRYRLDPVTGRMGMSEESTADQSRRLFSDLYADPAIAEMHGMRAGQLGELYEQLQARGMLRTAASDRVIGGRRGDDPRGQAARAVESMAAGGGPEVLARLGKERGVDTSRGVSGLSGDDLDKLTLDPAVADRMRQFDVDRAKRSLKSYVGVVQAVRDIFGELGRPNAPMQELMAGLEAMVGGSVGQIDPGRLSMIVRQTHNLARQTGVSFDNAMVLQQHAEQRAQAMGLEPIFGVQAAQGALGFGGAYRAQGHGAHAAWGAFDSDQVQQMDANLRVQAAGSNMADRAAVALRIRDAAGGFQEGTEAYAYTQALASGLDQYKAPDGSIRSVHVSDGKIVEMLTAAKGARGETLGISEGDVRDMINQRPTNREYVERYKIADVVRRVQGRDELHPFVGYRMQETLQSRLRDQLVRGGMDAKEATEQARVAASKVSQPAVRRMFEMSTEEFSDTDARNAKVAEILEQELGATEQGGMISALPEDERRAFLVGTADRFYGQANRAIASSMYSAFGNLQNVHRLTNKATLDEGDRQQMTARFESEMQEALAPLGRGTMLSRATEALRHARPGDDRAAVKVLAQALGGVRLDEVNRALLGPAQGIARQQDAVEALQAKVAAEAEPGRRADLMRQLDVARRELRGQASQLAQLGEKFGFYADHGVGEEELGRAISTQRQVERTQGDLTGVRTGSGGQVAPEEIAAVMHRVGPGTRIEAEAVLQARRLAEIDQLRAGGGTDPSKARLAAAMAAVAARHPGLEDGQAREAALRGMAMHATSSLSDPDDHPTQLTLEALQRNLEVRSPEEARALVLARRRLTPSAPTEAQVRDVMISHGDQVTESEAEEVAAARNRARRMGISPEQVRDRMINLDLGTVNREVAKLPGMAEVADKHRRWASAGRGVSEDVEDAQGRFRYTWDEFRRYHEAARPIAAAEYASPGAWRRQVAAIDTLLKDQQAAQYVVTPQQRQAYVAEFMGGKGVTAEQRDAFRRDDPARAGMPDAEVDAQVLDRLVLGKRGEAMRARFADFWKTEDGARFREDVALAGRDAEDVAAKLVATPHMVRRLGTRAVEMSGELRAGEQRTRELAMFHAGGDVSRLMAGDLDVPIHTAEGREAAESVRDEVARIQSRRREIMEALVDQQGRPGRQWELGDRREATRDVLEAAVKSGKIDRDRANRLIAALPTREQSRQVEARRRELGSESDARRVLGLPEDGDLTDWQRSKIQAVRQGAGNIGEVRAALGVGLEALLDPAVVSRAQKGVGSDRAAKDLIRRFNPGLKEEDFADDEMQERVRGLRHGLATDEHARELSRGADDLPAAERSAILKSVRLGRASEAFARESLGMAADETPPELVREIERRREEVGNRAEAARMLHLPKGARDMTESERAAFDAKVKAGAAEPAAMRALGLGPEVLSPKRSAELARAAAEVGVARRVAPDQEALVTGFAALESRMAKFAARQGSSAAEMGSYMELAGPDGRLSDKARAGLAARAIELTKDEREEVAAKAPAVAAGRRRLEAARAALTRAGEALDDPKADPATRKARLDAVDKAAAEVRAAEADEREAHAGLAGVAAKAGVTTTELSSGRRSGSKLEALAPEEEARRSAAHKAIGGADSAYRSAEGRVAAADVALGRIGDDTRDESVNRTRDRLTAERDRAREQAAKALSSRQAALATIEGDASRRGVTAAEYLRGEGYTNAATRKSYGEMAGEHSRDAAKVDSVAREIGVTRPDLLHAPDVTRRMELEQGEALRREQESPQALVRQVYKAYGIDVPEGKATPPQAELAQLMASPAGRDMARRVVSTQATLERHAEAGGGKGLAGVDAMAREYFKAQDATLDPKSRKESLTAFRRKYGVDVDQFGQMTGKGEGEWEELRQAMQFQQQTRFLQFGREGDGRKYKSDADLLEIYRSSMQGGRSAERPGAGGKADSEPMAITGNLTGTLKITGDAGDLVAAVGGTRDYTA